MNKIGIIGSGKWALAISKVLNTVPIIVKSRRSQKARKRFHNKKDLIITEKFSDLRSCSHIFIAIPSQSVRKNIKLLKKEIHDLNSVFVVCSKGIEIKTNKLMSEIIEEIYPQNKCLQI